MVSEIIIGDCRHALKSIPDKSVHLAVTSPPYNLNIEYVKWKDLMPFPDYMKFAKEWLQECYRVLRDDGRICVNIPIYTHKNYQQNLFTSYYKTMREIGFTDRDIILWIKTFSSKIPYGKVYGTWNPTNPRMHYPCEVILVMNKRDSKLNGWKSDITKSELYKWRRNVWFMEPEIDRSHPAPFPEELPRRLNKLFSFVGQTVLDPFLGSGTTMKVACELNRNCIGIEYDDGYLDMIKRKVGFNSSDFIVKYHKETMIAEPCKQRRLETKKPFSWREWERQLDEFFGYYR